MFRDKGYEVPNTDEFVALGEKAKADSRSFCTQPATAASISSSIGLTLLLSIDINAYGDLQNLKENARSNPAVRKALEPTVGLIDMAMWTPFPALWAFLGQMEFCNGNVLYACGSWKPKWLTTGPRALS